MQAGTGRRLLRAPQSRIRECWRRFGLAAVLLAGALAGGCTTSGQPAATLAVRSGPTVAFESIDGAPPAVFRKLVQNLGEEAAARAVPVVSRKGAAEYRVRGYLAAQTTGRTTAVTWVWDVYDNERRRALRIAGEHKVAAAGGDPWAATDDQMLRAIARTSMERVAAFIAAPGSPPAPAPEKTGEPAYRVASASRRNEPSAAARSFFGLFRTDDKSVPGNEAVKVDTATPLADVPLPPRRPRSAGVSPDRALAYAGARQ